MAEKGPIAAILFLFLIAMATPVPPQASRTAVTVAPPILVDTNVFRASVPSYMTTGQNASVLVRVTNTGNHSLPLVVELSAPLEVIYVNPLDYEVLVGPGSTVSTDFDLIPFKPSTGPFNVTASVWIANGSSTRTPLLVQTVTAQILVISQPAVYPLAGLSVILVAVTILSSYVILRRRRWKLT